MNPEIERLWDLTALVRSAVASILYGFFLARFLAAFSNHGPRPGWFAGAVYTAILLFCLLIPYEMTSAAAYLASAAGAFITYICLERGRPLIKLFACLTFEAVRRIASTAGSCAYIVLAALLLQPVDIDPAVQYRRFVFASAAEVATLAVTAYAALRVILRYFPDPHGRLTTGEFGLLCVPSIVAIVTTQVLHGLRQILDYEQSSVRVETLALVLVTVIVVSLGTTIVMFAKIRAEQDRHTDRELLDGQLASMRDYIAQMERNDRKMAQLRHDMANHMETIAALQERGDLGDASSYARRTYGELVSAQSAVRTGNPVSDVIVADQQQYAKQHGVQYITDFRFPTGLGIDAFDIGVILHNAGQNAIEAAAHSRDPWVHMQSRVHHKTVLIDVANSCAGPVRINPETGRPETSKIGEHGIGLRNIESAAKKYGGNVELSVTADTFRISILLPSPAAHS